jgi:hypothetical protein
MLTGVLGRANGAGANLGCDFSGLTFVLGNIDILRGSLIGVFDLTAYFIFLRGSVLNFIIPGICVRDFIVEFWGGLIFFATTRGCFNDARGRLSLSIGKALDGAILVKMREMGTWGGGGNKSPSVLECNVAQADFDET